MKKWRVNFYDKTGDELRSLTVEANNENAAELQGIYEADKRGWPGSFCVADAVPIQASPQKRKRK